MTRRRANMLLCHALGAMATIVLCAGFAFELWSYTTPVVDFRAARLAPAVGAPGNRLMLEKDVAWRRACDAETHQVVVDLYGSEISGTTTIRPVDRRAALAGEKPGPRPWDIPKGLAPGSYSLRLETMGLCHWWEPWPIPGTRVTAPFSVLSR